MGQENQVLMGAIRKLALAGEEAGFSVEEMIQLLKTGVSVETLLDLLCCGISSRISAPATHALHSETDK